MTKVVLFFVLDLYADWEAAYASSLINHLGKGQYTVKTVSLTKAPVSSLGGFTLLPDYDIYSTPDFSGLVLIGGLSWRNEEIARYIEPLVRKAYTGGKVLGAICDAVSFLGKQGMLNHVKHTANSLSDLQEWCGDNYSGADNFQISQAVRNANIITANGTAALEFAKEMLFALDIAEGNKIQEWIDFHKLGALQAPMPSV